MVVLAIIGAVAIPTYSAVLTRTSDKAHLLSLANIAAATSATYANGLGSPTWVDALNTVAGESTLAADLNASGTSIMAAVTLISPTQGASTASDTISYDRVPSGTTPVVSGSSVGLASQAPSGKCTMVLVGVSGVLAQWVGGKLGGNCTGATALLGPSGTGSITYLAPSDFGAPHP